MLIGIYARRKRISGCCSREASNGLSVLHEEKGKEKTIMVQRQKRELYNMQELGLMV